MTTYVGNAYAPYMVANSCTFNVPCLSDTCISPFHCFANLGCISATCGADACGVDGCMLNACSPDACGGNVCLVAGGSGGGCPANICGVDACLWVDIWIPFCPINFLSEDPIDS